MVCVTQRYFHNLWMFGQNFNVSMLVNMEFLECQDKFHIMPFQSGQMYAWIFRDVGGGVVSLRYSSEELNEQYVIEKLS